MKDNKTDFKIKLEVLNRTKSKFNTKCGCKLRNLEKIEINNSDKNITLNKKAKGKTYAYTTKETSTPKLNPKFKIKQN